MRVRRVQSAYRYRPVRSGVPCRWPRTGRLPHVFGNAVPLPCSHSVFRSIRAANRAPHDVPEASMRERPLSGHQQEMTRGGCSGKILWRNAERATEITKWAFLWPVFPGKLSQQNADFVDCNFPQGPLAVGLNRPNLTERPAAPLHIGPPASHPCVVLFSDGRHSSLVCGIFQPTCLIR